MTTIECVQGFPNDALDFVDDARIRSREGQEGLFGKSMCWKSRSALCVNGFGSRFVTLAISRRQGSGVRARSRSDVCLPCPEHLKVVIVAFFISASRDRSLGLRVTFLARAALC
jgi:hypothetical protein